MKPKPLLEEGLCKAIPMQGGRSEIMFEQLMLSVQTNLLRVSRGPNSFYQPHVTLLRLPRLGKLEPFIRLSEEIFPILHFPFSSITCHKLKQVHRSAILSILALVFWIFTHLMLFSSIPPTVPGSGKIPSLINTRAPGLRAGTRFCKILIAYASDQLWNIHLK